MTNTTFICLRGPATNAGWTIYHVAEGGMKEPILCFRHYLDAARMLRHLRTSRPGARH